MLGQQGEPEQEVDTVYTVWLLGTLPLLWADTGSGASSHSQGQLSMAV